jgi:hypothetical protein
LSSSNNIVRPEPALANHPRGVKSGHSANEYRQRVGAGSRSFQSFDAVVAAFPSPDRAKSAMAALERNGTPSRNVRLLSDPPVATTSGVRNADARKLNWARGRIVAGALVGAVIGVIIMVAVVTLLYGTGWLPTGLSALAGALFGAVVGAMVWFSSRTPRHPRAWDTYLVAHRNETCLAVAVRGQAEDAQTMTILRREGAESLERIPASVGA